MGLRRAAPPPPRQGLIAAAVHYRVGERITTQLRGSGTNTEWQKQAWECYDEVGELHYASNYLGRAMSKAGIVAAKIVPGEPDPEPIDKGPAAELAAAFLGGLAARPGHLLTLGLHRMVSGESWIVAEDIDGDERWSVFSESEVTVSGSVSRPRVTVIEEDGRSRILGDKALVIHGWVGHPRRRGEVDSPVRGALRTLRKLIMLDDYAASTMLSRLTSAGLMTLPKDVTFPRPPNVPGSEEMPEDVHPFMWALMMSMRSAVRDPASAEARLPILAEVPPEAVDAIKHLTFDTPLHRDGAEWESQAIRRLALALDLPPEILMGTGSTNHWGSWQIDEATIKTHIEPALGWVCYLGTQGYLRPALGSAGRDIVLWYDTTSLKLRPDRSKEAVELYDRGELSGEDLREEAGFGDREAPAGEKLERQLLMQVLRNQPQLVAQVLAALGMPNAIEIPAAPAPQPDDQDDDEDGQDGQGPPPGGDQRPDDQDEPPVAASALLSAADMAVTAALTRAGNHWLGRNRALRASLGDTLPHTLYLRATLTDTVPADRLLGDVFATMAPRMAALHGGNPERLRAALHAYTTGLIERREPHDLTRLAGVLAGCRG